MHPNRTARGLWSNFIVPGASKGLADHASSHPTQTDPRLGRSANCNDFDSMGILGLVEVAM
jgi:hypothetical protein